MSTTTPSASDTPAAPPPPTDHTVLAANVTHNLSLLLQATQLLEPRFTTRALRSLPQLRTRLGKGGEVLAEVIRTANIYHDNAERKQSLIDILGNPPAPPKDDPAASSSTVTAPSSAMQLDESTPAPSAPASGRATPAPAAGTDDKTKEDKDKEAAEKAKEKEAAAAERRKEVQRRKQLEELKGVGSTLPEADAFVSLLVVVSLLDQKKYEEGKRLSTQLIEQFTALNRRSLDQLMSKLYFYWVRLHEVSGEDTGALRPTLLTAQRTAALRHDADLQATLLPLLLRNYLEHGLYDQADRLVSKTTFPEGTAGNGQLARWFYYVGRIRAIQLDYTAAHSSLLQAIRRAPSDLSAAPGFFQHAHKLAVVVELLMGEIPERRVFREPVLRRALRPYFELAQAVRIGDIQAFNLALSTHAAVFHADRNHTLVLRLRHTVIKTALRTLSLAYSRITLRDVASHLALDGEEDAEYVVAKAIRDGVVVARIDHEKGEMASRETGDVYATGEPMKEFDRRIGFLLELYNQSVKSMRYPLNAHSKELASAGEARERERELAKEIEDGDEDAEFDGGDMEGF
ncbi:hypothetical protein JCM10207_004727 [Rhodosporidiobolus poonsookiae]